MPASLRPSRCVRTPNGKPSSDYRRKGVRAVSHGLAAFLISIVLVSTAMIGAAWALAASMQARSDIRHSAGYVPPSDRLSWPASRASEWSMSVFEKTSGVEFDLDGTFELFAVKVDDASAEHEITGSVGTFKLAALDTSTPVEFAKPALKMDGAIASTPIPKPRPKLAALTPMQGVGISPDVETYPQRTAIYDITAKIVHMPNGEKLEAHSGLGSMMDDPKYIHVKGRGPTPPNVYNLRMREALFHGVAAIRMLPENEKMMFGRDGILTHSYLRGPSGQSAGCVSFRDYPRFLKAFQRGEVTRIIVVPKLTRSPTFASRGPGAL
jgi:hypothetical protein